MEQDKTEEQKQEENQEAGDKKLSVAQKKKLKEKQKKEAEALLKAQQQNEGNAQPAQEPEKKDAKGAKKKPLNAAAALALEKKRLIAEAQAEQEKIERELKEKEEEEERKRQEEEQRLKDIDEAKKKEKKDKIDELKSKGQWLSKKDLIKKQEWEKKRAQMIAQGLIKLEDIEKEKEDDQNQDAQKKKSTMIKNKKNKDKNAHNKQEQQIMESVDQNTEENAIEEKQENAQSVEVQQEKKIEKKEQKQDSDSAVEDWENADIDEIASKIKVNKEQIQKNVKDDEEDKALSVSTASSVQKKPAPQIHQKAQTKEEEKESVNIFDNANESEQQKAERLRLRKEENLRRLQERNNKLKTKQQQKMRCPIVCILGHVDTGKTLILDKLRRTNVQAGEAGGITQQIGATFFPKDYIEGHIEKVKNRMKIDLQLPGFLIIDTPGHESFTNLRSRGSSLCDIAILVVDLMHGLEQQTLESIELLRQKKCPFIVALNKIDRCYEWKSKEFNNVRDSLEQQQQHTINEFNDRLDKTKLAFAEIGFNTCVYWENENVEEYLSFCPTSAITGEGLPDLMTYLSLMCQTRIPKQLYEREEFECTVLEVKVIEGLGTTIDVILLNGIIKVQDTIVLQGFNGPIVTQIRALLTPQPMKELRVKNEYQSHQKIRGAMGIKISAPGLENAIAGSELLRANTEKEIELAKAEINDNLYDILDKYVDKSQEGVCVQASTLGSLEALLEFLKTSKIPVVNISIGPVHKKDVMKAMKALAADESKQKKEFATLLAFDVRITPEAAKFAEEEGIKIFSANIIYHLFDEFTKYVKECQESRKTSQGSDAIFPCALEIVKDACFNRSNPIIMGVIVKAGVLKLGTPLCIPEKENLRIGVVDSIQLNKQNVTKATAKDGSVAVRIGGQQHIMFGRQFDETNQVCSWQTRKSIDALKEFYRDEMTMDDWKLIKALKAKYNIE